jgi:(p)ppGpp synthase/HD superfamily hydrolase
MGNSHFSERVFDAILFAARAHTGQFRKGTSIPYIVHPLGVAKLLIELCCPEPVIIAGILHDTVEDTTVTLDEIRQSFGEKVAHLVSCVSEHDKSAPWEVRKQLTLDYLQKEATNNVLLIACADKLDNIKSMREGYDQLGEALWESFNRPKAAQQWYFRSLVKIFSVRMKGARGTPLFRRFEFEVQQVFGI